MQKAKVTALWIGEVNPDLFSRLIQRVLRRNFSHNALIFDGEIWHGTTSEDPRYDGFCNEPIEQALKDHVVRYCCEVETRFTHDELKGHLNARKGTPYSMRQNIGAIYTFLLDCPLTSWFFRTGKFAVNCSEVLAEVCQSDRYDFGDLDRVKPTDTLVVLGGQPCQHDHTEKR